MKRFHVNLAVEDLAASVRFYSALFGAEPTVLKGDYTKWMLDDPRVNFALSARPGRAPGLDHPGLQVEEREALPLVYARMREAAEAFAEQGEVTCCYARSEKAWVRDPQGVAWEAFFTRGESTVYGDGTGEAPPPPAGAQACRKAGAAP